MQSGTNLGFAHVTVYSASFQYPFPPQPSFASTPTAFSHFLPRIPPFLNHGYQGLRAQTAGQRPRCEACDRDFVDETALAAHLKTSSVHKSSVVQQDKGRILHQPRSQTGWKQKNENNQRQARGHPMVTKSEVSYLFPNPRSISF